jgi:protein-S-isoprenylcysteine O-methyltransferase Ste14
VEWVYLTQHVLVMGIALTRPPPLFQDHSLRSSLAVLVAYTYPYAQVIFLGLVPGQSLARGSGLVLVMLSAGLSFLSLMCIGRYFGIRPAVRGVATNGPYRVVRHPMYLSYVISDIGYNLEEGNLGTALIVMVGWASLLYRIGAEERVLSRDARWAAYRRKVKYRLLPGLW